MGGHASLLYQKSRKGPALVRKEQTPRTVERKMQSRWDTARRTYEGVRTDNVPTSLRGSMTRIIPQELGGAIEV